MEERILFKTVRNGKSAYLLFDRKKTSEEGFIFYNTLRELFFYNRGNSFPLFYLSEVEQEQTADLGEGIFPILPLDEKEKVEYEISLVDFRIEVDLVGGLENSLRLNNALI